MAVKIGLALGGGGARGLAHVGVIEAMRAAGVPIHCIAGTSIGAIVGAAVAAGRMEQIRIWAREPDWRKLPRLFFETRLTTKALMRGDRIASFLRELIPAATFADLPMPFAAVATDLATGERVVMTEGDLLSAVRASMSIPGVFAPVERDGRTLVDGGLVDPVPVAACRALGAERVMAIDLNGPECAATGKRPGRINLMDVLLGAFRIVNAELTRRTLAVDAPDVLLQPPVGDVMMLDFRHAERLIDVGRSLFEGRRGEVLQKLGLASGRTI